MTTRNTSWLVSTALTAGLLAPALAQAQEQVPALPAPAVQAADAAAAAPLADNEGMQVLDQGPIHEAFAEPVALDAQASVTVDREPPAPINEIPPDVRPEGKNVQWISGYWMWTDEQKDFIWVSGVWRDIPPGRRWVPGNWASVDGRFQWVPGFWAAEQVQEVNMLPHPPATLEAGPSSPAPGDNYFWVPGCWRYGDAGYAWRAGYWYAGQQNWVWVPDHYSYTPQGSIFVNGYWDYGIANRGWLYAPVYYSRPIYVNAGYIYRPYSLINSSLLLSSLFIHDNYNSYYYGYGGWRGNSIRPWWDYGYGRHRHYNPFYAYHRWHDGHNHNDWIGNVRRDWDHHHGDWDRDRDRGDWDRDRNGRPGGRPDDGRPGGGRPGDGRPNGDGRPGSNADQLVTTPDQIARGGGIARVHRLTDAEREAARDRVKSWDQIRQARVEAGANGVARIGDGKAQGTVRIDGGVNREGAGSDQRPGRETAGNASGVGQGIARQGRPGEAGDQPGNRDRGPGANAGVDTPGAGVSADGTVQAGRDGGQGTGRARVQLPPNDGNRGTPRLESGDTPRIDSSGTPGTGSGIDNVPGLGNRRPGSGGENPAIIGRPITPPTVGGEVGRNYGRGNAGNRATVQRPTLPGDANVGGRGPTQPRVTLPGNNGNPAGGRPNFTPRSSSVPGSSQIQVPGAGRGQPGGNPAIRYGGGEQRNVAPRPSGPSAGQQNFRSYSTGPSAARSGGGPPTINRGGAPQVRSYSGSGGGGRPAPSVDRGNSGGGGGQRAMSSGGGGGGRSGGQGGGGGGDNRGGGGGGDRGGGRRGR